MGEIWFVTKTLIATCFLLWVLQIKVGSETLENKAHTWIASSETANYLRNAAEGVIYFTQMGVEKGKAWAAEQTASKHHK